MKYVAKIQVEFLKEARKWDKLSIEDQKAYLKRHPKSKRRITAKPKSGKKKTTKAIVEGQRVRLKPNKREGWPEEFGKVETIEKGDELVMVRVDKKYRDSKFDHALGKYDDGLREVTIDQLEGL